MGPVDVRAGVLFDTGTPHPHPPNQKDGPDPQPGACRTEGPDTECRASNGWHHWEFVTPYRAGEAAAIRGQPSHTGLKVQGLRRLRARVAPTGKRSHRPSRTRPTRVCLAAGNPSPAAPRKPFGWLGPPTKDQTFVVTAHPISTWDGVGSCGRWPNVPKRVLPIYGAMM